MIDALSSNGAAVRRRRATVLLRLATRLPFTGQLQWADLNQDTQARMSTVPRTNPPLDSQQNRPFRKPTRYPHHLHLLRFRFEQTHCAGELTHSSPIHNETRQFEDLLSNSKRGHAPYLRQT